MITKPSKAKVAVIGCGLWGRNLVRNYYNLGALATFVEADRNTAATLENQFNVKPQDLTEVLQNPRIHAVAVAVPTAQHYLVAKQALMAGKHLFIEKPVTMALEQTIELIKLAEERKVVFMTGHLPRYHPAFIRMQEMVSNGDIGSLKYVYSNRLNLGRIRSDENCLWDLAPHDISMILALVGEQALEVHTQGSSGLHSQVVDTALVSLQFNNGVKGHIFNSWLHPFKEHRLVAVGDKGMLVFDDAQPWESKLQLFRHDIDITSDLKFQTHPKEAQNVFIEPDEPLKMECEHFLTCIENKEAPLTGPKEALRVMTLMEMIQGNLRLKQELRDFKAVVNE